MNFLLCLQRILDSTRAIDFIGPLALRLYLVPVFLMAGLNKYNSFEDTAAWFGNPDWGLGLPFPELMAFLATSSELLGAAFLLVGFAVRWISIPLIITMIVAMVTVHWENGWFAIADAQSCLFNCDGAIAAGEKLAAAKDILQANGNYEWLTSSGNFIISNNGIEFAATYLIMLVVLFFVGAGKYFSVDYWIKRSIDKN